MGKFKWKFKCSIGKSKSQTKGNFGKRMTILIQKPVQSLGMHVELYDVR